MFYTSFEDRVKINKRIQKKIATPAKRKQIYRRAIRAPEFDLNKGICFELCNQLTGKTFFGVIDMVTEQAFPEFYHFVPEGRMLYLDIDAEAKAIGVSRYKLRFTILAFCVAMCDKHKKKSKSRK